MDRTMTLFLRLGLALMSTACAVPTPSTDGDGVGVANEVAVADEALTAAGPRLCLPRQCGPRPGLPNHICPDGTTVAGPTGRCLREPDGGCGWEIVQCPKKPCAATGQCDEGEHCSVEDGDCNRPPGCSPRSVCPALCYGVCVPNPSEPPGRFCGGIAGIPCPGGGRCQDDPSDDCDPNNGGADCGGICSCVESVLCVKGSHFNSDPNVCACEPDGVQCGNRVCGADQICCSPSCGICGSKGGFCPQIACQVPLQ